MKEILNTKNMENLETFAVQKVFFKNICLDSNLSMDYNSTSNNTLDLVFKSFD